MAYAQIHTQAPRHPKLLALSDAAWRLWATGLCYVQEHMTDGIIPAKAIVTFGVGKPQKPLPNVWLGVSVEDQATADARIPLLLQTPAAIRFVSYEPALGPVNLTAIRRTRAEGFMRPLDGRFNRLDWVIVGGESGPKARPCDVEWIRSVVQQCKAAGTPCFVKQLGAHIITRNDDGWEGDTPRSWPMNTRFDEHIRGYREDYQGAPVRVRLRCRKGGHPSEWPEDLRVRQWPEVARG
ncbi:MAG: DUF5131 family protein [Planctomycetes bacterium]|nr:DUF5131 family protein [Planctomycetota bacterium]